MEMRMYCTFTSLGMLINVGEVWEHINIPKAHIIFLEASHNEKCLDPVSGVLEDSNPTLTNLFGDSQQLNLKLISLP
jgi:hypothetical protein